MKWRPHKKKLGVLLVVVLMVFCVGWEGVLDDNDQDMIGNWTFWKDVQVKEDLDVDLTLTVDGASTLTGDVAATGSVTIGDVMILEVASATGTYSMTTAAGNILLVSGSAFTVTLPAITEAMDGYIFIIKNTATAAAKTVTPGSADGSPVDLIESTRGDGTGTSDTAVDAAGDMKAWVADFTSSSTSGVWRYLYEDKA